MLSSLWVDSQWRWQYVGAFALHSVSADGFYGHSMAYLCQESCSVVRDQISLCLSDGNPVGQDMTYMVNADLELMSTAAA